MIRQATPEDLPRLVELGRLMVEESPEFRVMPYRPEKVQAMLSTLIESPRGFVVVGERQGTVVGGMVAAASEQWFSDALCAFDLCMFVDPAHRGTLLPAQLLMAYRSWAKRLGVARATAGISTGVHVEQTEQLYRRMGLRHVGPIFDVLEG
ncbi:GNAT family N-acetyltransferase [Eleftheria terrae]|uniref:GNAT family N-acetyltransferase n=1 Tax=Eleftheria terrae TaxID=1597781 RepID=UPI00263B671B|nr:GNAT family N-acetyltransferase [Eleftheria terrae]WKB53021.1 GNAT family N-acetyltransferase [Eleftheria terrae]